MAFVAGLKFFSYTDNAESIFDYSPWYLNQKGKWVEYKVESWKRHGQGYVCKLAKVWTFVKMRIAPD